MALFRPGNRRSAATAMIATVLGVAGADLGRSKRLLRCAAVALLVLATPALVWASFTIINYPVVNVVSTGGVTLSGPTSVAVDSQGNVYIADGGNHQVVEVTAAGVASVVSFAGLSPSLASATAVAVDGSGNLYVADIANARVVKLAAGVASVVATASLLTNPSGLAFDAAGDLYIADATHSYIVEVPAGGTAAVLSISGLGTALSQPAGLAVDLLGNLYIADSVNNRIVTVTTGGVGSALTITGETLNTPLGVAADWKGNVYIADDNNSRVLAVAPGGSAAVLDAPLFGTFPSPVPLTLNHPAGVAVDATGNIYIADTTDNHVDEVMPSAANFGHLSSTASSGTTMTLPFLLGGFPTISSVQAYTLGTPALDFTVVAGSGTTCVPGFTGSGDDVACTVEVSFLPTGAGLRRGALVIYDSETPPAPIITIPLSGTGDAPLAALSPGTAALASVGGATLSQPFQVAFDQAGNMYVANYGSVAGNVVKVAAGGGSSSVVSVGGFTLAGAIGVVLDGAGNLYISDHDNDRILEVPVVGSVFQLNINGLSTGLSLPTAITMDQSGNLYISDYGNGRVVKVTPSGAGSVVATTGFTFPSVSVLGVAVDTAGTVYIPDSAGNRVVKVTASGAASLVVPTGITPPTLSSPRGVAVDAFGNLYIADSGHGRIVQITTAGVASVVQMPGQTLATDFGVTVDVAGNIFVPDFGANHIVQVNVAGATLPAFASTHVGASSSSQTATVTNLGDLPLVFSANPTFTANFSQPTGSANQCLIATSLTGGEVCSVSVQFTPQSVGSLSASIGLANNNLNVASSTQAVAVSGTGLVALADATSTAVSVTPTNAGIGQPLILTATVTDTTTGHTATVPTGGVTFMDTVGSTSVSLNGGSAVTLIGGIAALTGVTLSGAGAHTLTANYAGVSGTFAASTNTTTLTVSKDTAAIAGPATQPVPVPVGEAGSVTITVTGPYSATAPPSGSLSYSVLNSSSTSVASGSAQLTAGDTSSSGTVPFVSSLPPGTYTVSITYSGDGNYAASETATTVQVVVGQITPTISWTPPAGTFTYGGTLSGILIASASSGGSSIPGTFSYTATLAGGSPVAVTAATVLNAGVYSLTVTFTPTNTAAYKPATASLTLTVNQAASVVALVTSASTVLATNPVTFTATVSSAAGTPTGSVSFFDGTKSLDSVALTAGVANFTTSSLAAGAHSITAQYGGAPDFSTVASTAVTETVHDFSLTVGTGGTTSATVMPGGVANYALVIGPIAGTTFPAPVTLSLTGLPPGATGTLTPKTLPAGSGFTNVTLTIQLPSVTASLRHHETLALQLSPMMLSMLLFPFAGKIRRSVRKQGPLALLLLATLGASLLALSGCGSKNTGFLGTPQTSYVLTVRATSGNLSHSTTLNLTVE